MGLVDAMHLRRAVERVPIVGARLIVRGRYVALDYGHPRYYMRLPSPSRLWRHHVTAGGPVCLTVCLEPLPPGHLGVDAVETYLARAVRTDRAYMGATTIRTR
ncbi:hypothetical protein [Streptomyces sp. YIM 121038]|uniref:hypothetical protein n=1 Tax=Streptomyces sp. YIM 121038 TaxID=2136401 RepID=UPI002017398A|nr:hypothetical protein [Streptomyces sp. YIM 121038]